MKKRKNRYLIYSLLIHLILASVIWQFRSQQQQQEWFFEGQEIVIHRIRLPIVKPPEPIKPQASTEPASIEEKVVRKPPKPTAGLSAAWVKVKPDEAVVPTVRGHTDAMNKIANTPMNSAPVPQHTPTANLDVKARRIRSAIENPSMKTAADVPRRSADFQISLGGDGTLNAASPMLDSPDIYYSGKRGDALRTTSMGNSWGGSSSGTATVGGIYVSMMKTLASELANAAITEKVDVVFILDETESMSDNIRGIRAYVHFIFDALRRDGHDATFGLVLFSDEVKTYKSTNDSGTFRNWLFKIGTDGGGTLLEAGLDALMAAVEQMNPRRGAQRLFVLASDAAFHDADYNGMSTYSLDTVIETLQREQIRVDIIGLDHLPVKQIAMATGGTWHPIPGKGYREYVPPLPLTEKMFSKLGMLDARNGGLNDKIIVYFNNPPRPKRLALTWKVLNPLGERCYGPFTKYTEIAEDNSTQIELTPTFEPEVFQKIHGIYTIVYRLENEQGHRSILKRFFEFP